MNERLKSLQKMDLSLSPDMEEKDLTRLRDILQENDGGSAKISLRIRLPEEKTVVEINPEGIPRDVRVTRELIEKVYQVLKNPNQARFF